MKASEHWPSTKGLSVYNALSLSGRDMRPSEIVSFLREIEDDEMDDAYVLAGIEFLSHRRLISVVNGLITIPLRNPRTRTGRRLVKTKDESDLVYERF